MLDQLIQDFHNKLYSEKIGGNDSYEDQIINLYKLIINNLGQNYDSYISYIAFFLSSLEKNNDAAIPYEVDYFIDSLNEIIKSKNYKKFAFLVVDNDVDEEIDNSIIEKYFEIFHGSYSTNSNIRIFDDSLDLTALSEIERKRIASFIIDKLLVDSKNFDWKSELIQDTLLLLVGLRQLLKSLNNIDLFYYSVGVFLDRISTSEYFQAGRDISEEIIITSFKDNVPELGFFNAFRFYSNTNNIHGALLYANLSLTIVLRKGAPFSDKLIKELIWQGIKFFRNVDLTFFVEKLYANIPKELNFLNYERRSIDHTYFTAILKQLKPESPSLLQDYLNKERETILKRGIDDALPWLITLYNVKRLYPNADFSLQGLGFYLHIFELIVPRELVKKYKVIIEGESDELKEYLKESILKLNATRSAGDFVYDNEAALNISSRLLKYSINKKDSAGFLLSMLLKSDYSILFIPIKREDIAPLKLPNSEVDSFTILYDDSNVLFDSLSLQENISLVWLGFSEGGLFQLSLINNIFDFASLTRWNNEFYSSIIDSNYFTDFSFEETKFDNGVVRDIYPEEYKIESKKVSQELGFCEIELSPSTESVYLVKDMHLSNYPHNLFLNNGEFLSRLFPVTNILSTEWFIKNKNSKPLENNYSKSIWV